MGIGEGGVEREEREAERGGVMQGSGWAAEMAGVKGRLGGPRSWK